MISLNNYQQVYEKFIPTKMTKFEKFCLFFRKIKVQEEIIYKSKSMSVTKYTNYQVFKGKLFILDVKYYSSVHVTIGGLL